MHLHYCFPTLIKKEQFWFLTPSKAMYTRHLNLHLSRHISVHPTRKNRRRWDKGDAMYFEAVPMLN